MISKFWRDIARGVWFVGCFAAGILFATSGLLAALPALLCLAWPAANVLLVEWATRGTVPGASVNERAYIEARETGILKACDDFQWPEDTEPWHPLYVASPSVPVGIQRSDQGGLLKLWNSAGALCWLDPKDIQAYSVESGGVVQIFFYGGQIKTYYRTAEDARDALQAVREFEQSLQYARRIVSNNLAMLEPKEAT